MYSLGNLYTVTGGDSQYNSTCIFRYSVPPLLMGFEELTSQTNKQCRFLQNPTEEARKGVTLAGVEEAHQRILLVQEALKQTAMSRPDSKLILEEVHRAPRAPSRGPSSLHPPFLPFSSSVVQIAHGAAMADVSCRAMMLSLKEGTSSPEAEWQELQEMWEALRRQHEALWLRRNRPGGLQESLKRFVPFARFLTAKLGN
jgi:hypothetical protein